MIRSAARALALLVVPLAGLAALWASSENLSRQGTDWEVAIQGYDPRDLLRGHYVEFRYDWPIRAQEPAQDGVRAAMLRHLCLIGDPPEIAEVLAFDDPNDPLFAQCEHPLSVQPGGVYGYSGLERGRLYVGQDRAKALEESLLDREQRGIVRFRQREDGVLTPIDIRFRPLSAQEREDRNRARAGDAVMDEAADLAADEEPENE